MLTTATSAILAAVVALGLVSIASPASADTAGCVTKAEFNRVSTGDTIARVTRVFDTRGTIIAQGAGNQTREYRTCRNSPGIVHIGYQNKRLVSKHGW